MKFTKDEKFLIKMALLDELIEADINIDKINKSRKTDLHKQSKLEFWKKKYVVTKSALNKLKGVM